MWPQPGDRGRHVSAECLQCQLMLILFSIALTLDCISAVHCLNMFNCVQESLDKNCSVITILDMANVHHTKKETGSSLVPAAVGKYSPAVSSRLHAGEM